MQNEKFVSNLKAAVARRDTLRVAFRVSACGGVHAGQKQIDAWLQGVDLPAENKRARIIRAAFDYVAGSRVMHRDTSIDGTIVKITDSGVLVALDNGVELLCEFAEII